MGNHVSLDDGGPLAEDSRYNQPYIESAIYKFHPLNVPNRPKTCLISNEIRNPLGKWHVVALKNPVSGKLAVIVIMVQGKIALYSLKVDVIRKKNKKSVQDVSLMRPVWPSNTLTFDDISVTSDSDINSFTFTLGVKEIITEMPIRPVDKVKKSRFIIPYDKLTTEEHLYNFGTHFYDELGFCWQLKYKNANKQLHFFVYLVNGIYNEEYDISFKLYHKWFFFNKKVVYTCTPKSSSERISDSFMDVKNLSRYLQGKSNLNFRLKVDKVGKKENIVDKLVNQYV
jgi:hypothetical protein